MIVTVSWLLVYNRNNTDTTAFLTRLYLDMAANIVDRYLQVCSTWKMLMDHLVVL